MAKAGAGKTTLSEYLVKNYGFKKLSFADALKEIAVKYFGMTKKDRKLLQDLGAKMREINPDVWANIIKQKLEYGQLLHVVIDDCRYKNEAKMLKDFGFVLVRLVGRGYELPEGEACHQSETEMAEIFCDYELDNSGSLEESYKKLDDIIESRSWTIVGD